MTKKDSAPFSFHKASEAADEGDPPAPPEFVVASDGVKLAVRVYRPRQNPPKAILIFYHGGGAHSGAGYQMIGHGLSNDICNEYGVMVYTPDLRGHGASEGPRGDASSVEQVFLDINTVLEHVQESTSPDADIPILLGGHSSGGGLVVNYSAWPGRKAVKGYALVSPQLCHESGTARPLESKTTGEFAKVNVLAFIANAIFGILGHNKAVRFNYPAEVLANDPGMVSWNTVNMANAITPQAPQDQISNINLPLGIWVGSEDELFVADKVAAFTDGIKEPGRGTCGVVIPGENHLGILVQAHQFLGAWITKCIDGSSS